MFDKHDTKKYILNFDLLSEVIVDDLQEVKQKNIFDPFCKYHF